jgi:hypothetical protein
MRLPYDKGGSGKPALRYLENNRENKERRPEKKEGHPKKENPGPETPRRSRD